ncbi:MAG: cell division protein ZapB [Elusimicrobia bacterium]|jgi:FtsZ-binding cell division protein ZapB|nr:cell division protein ZapB [Elusimicrobiota bacterium]MBK7545500.1 cell division protein ZapB [Elusimicrobiota bacterium]MBK7575310.1 cell division protein ZapB [Elusimicrobiota bacterium]MBK7687950.1 cell division protein ZapB [Elusimicrobiota bacterium]MBK8125133.1 cell division protein ZapB [Elusimicrobiota bacterium]
MPSPLLTKLAEKVRQATGEIHHLRKERERLQAELTLMGDESRRARRLLREHGELIEERERLRSRLEKILDKLDRLKIA